MNDIPRERRRCQSHCAACGSCFSSDSAFDAHRRSFACWDDGADERVRVLRDDAVCEIGFEVPQLGRTLYAVNPDFRSNSRAGTASGADLDPEAA